MAGQTQPRLDGHRSLHARGRRFDFSVDGQGVLEAGLASPLCSRKPDPSRNRSSTPDLPAQRRWGAFPEGGTEP